MEITNKTLAVSLFPITKLWEWWCKAPERELAKCRIKEAKLKEKANKKIGLVKLKDLKRSGQELFALGIFMTRDEIKAFSVLCEGCGVQFSYTKNSTKKNNSGVKAYEIICRKNDLEKIVGIIGKK